VGPLVDYFVHNIALEQGKPAPTVPGSVIAALERHGYPGNVRQLYNMAHHAVTCHDGAQLALADFPGVAAAPVRVTPQVDRENPLFGLFGKFPTVMQVEEYLIAEAMKMTCGSQ